MLKNCMVPPDINALPDPKSISVGILKITLVLPCPLMVLKLLKVVGAFKLPWLNAVILIWLPTVNVLSVEAIKLLILLNEKLLTVPFVNALKLALIGEPYPE